MAATRTKPRSETFMHGSSHGHPIACKGPGSLFSTRRIRAILNRLFPGVGHVSALRLGALVPRNMPRPRPLSRKSPRSPGNPLMSDTSIHSDRPTEALRRFRHLLPGATAMAAVAGYVNSVVLGFFHTPVSHMTGAVSRTGIDLAGERKDV